MNRRGSVKVLALFGMALFSSVAYATDNSVNAGVVCRQYGTAGTYAMFWGTVINLSTTSGMQVVCPLMRDATNIGTAQMTVWDTNTTQDVSCDFRYEFASGSFISNFVTTATSSGFSNNVQHVSRAGISGGWYYYTFCSIPPVDNGQFSSINALWLFEN